MAILPYKNAYTQLKQLEPNNSDINNAGNCVIVAFAMVLNCKYSEAFNLLQQELNIKHKRGVEFRKVSEYLKATSTEEYNVLTNKEVLYFNQWVQKKMHPRKTYLIIVRSHILTVKNGVIYGNTYDSKLTRKQLYGVYKIN